MYRYTNTVPERITIQTFTFKDGVEPPENKLSRGRELEEADIPEEVVLPLRQHIGSDCKSLVGVGDKVKVGEKIGECDSPPCAPVHATVSGKVVEIEERLCPVGGEIKSVIIESDGKDNWADMEGMDWKSSSAEDLISKVKECGVVGLGGAAFPTWMKLNPPEDKNIDS